MSNDKTHTLCPYCNRRVDPNEPGVIYAVEQVEMLTMGPTRTNVDGMGGFFHPECPPEAIGWVRRERLGT